MAHYPLRTTDDELANLIDKAVAGEEVIITRQGKPAVELRVVVDVDADARRREIYEDLRRLRESQTMSDVSSADLIRQMRDEGP